MQGIDDEFVGVEGRQHHHRNVGHGRLQLRHRLNPIHDRHTDIHQHNIRALLRNQLHAIAPIAGLAHHFDVACAL
ncbi:hypothetical protein AZH45_07075 [Corynebacterium striatum]|nr:hypothetical protein AZH45_07075 [Corynebacterium striatum]